MAAMVDMTSVLSHPVRELSGTDTPNLTSENITFVDLSTPASKPPPTQQQQQLPSTAGSSPVRQINATFDRRHSTASSSLASTPPSAAPPPSRHNATFDASERAPPAALPSKKFSVPDGHHLNATFDRGGQQHLNATFEKGQQLNATFDKGQHLNATFEKGGQHLNATFEKGHHLNATFDKGQHLNATFDASNRAFEVNNSEEGVGAGMGVGGAGCTATFTRRKMSDVGVKRFSRESSQDGHLMDEDRFSSTSDSSVSHRLNDVGDVQQLARMQEESKCVMLLFPRNVSPFNILKKWYQIIGFFLLFGGFCCEMA